MPDFVIVTMEQTRSMYRVKADTAEEAQQEFDHGNITTPYFSEALDVEVTNVHQLDENGEVIDPDAAE